MQILNWACEDSVQGHNLGIFLKRIPQKPSYCQVIKKIEMGRLHLRSRIVIGLKELQILDALSQYTTEASIGLSKKLEHFLH